MSLAGVIDECEAKRDLLERVSDILSSKCDVKMTLLKNTKLWKIMISTIADFCLCRSENMDGYCSILRMTKKMVYEHLGQDWVIDFVVGDGLNYW